jgi:flagellar hook-associated protein 2
MGSPTTFSGFNGIDFSVILNSVMQQASQPLTAMQTRQTEFKSQLTALGKLTTQANTLQQAAKDLQKSTSADAVAASTTDATAVGVSSGSGAIAGRYDVVVQSLAHAQVTTSVETAPDADTTAVATGGTLTIGGKTVTLTGSVTIQQLASAINTTTDIGVTASVVRSGAGAYRLVLTGKNTGADESFTITSGLTGSTLTFAGNAVEASDASITVNNVDVTSSTNTFDAAVPGVTLTVLKADPDSTVGVNVTASSAALKTRIDAFVKAFNDVVSFTNDQKSARAKGENGNLARDPVLRQISLAVRTALTAAHGSGAIDRLSQIGVEFTLTGTLKLTASKLEAALTEDPDAVLSLVTGATGAFGEISTALDVFTASDGLLHSGTDRINTQIRSLDNQLAKAQDRLAAYRQSMQQEFTAADMAMSRLRSQSSALTGFGS